MYTVKSKIEIKVTEDDIADILAIAFEGGITYWCESVSCDNDESDYRYYSEIGAYTDTPLIISVIDEVDTHQLTKDKLLNGIKLAYEAGCHVDYMWVKNGKIDVINVDSEVADCIVQFAIFEDIIYG